MTRFGSMPSVSGVGDFGAVGVVGGFGGLKVRTAAALSALLALLAAGLLAGAPATAQTATCPFDDGNSSLAVEGVVLTRYALGITGAPLVANTGINAVDAPTVEAAINCPSCGLNITGNPTMTVADATIISRKLAGFSGAALTNGVALGSGTRNTVTAVNSFLLAGCGGASANAFVNGGNAFGGDATIGTLDAHDLTMRSSGTSARMVLSDASGLRISKARKDYVTGGYLLSHNTVSGFSANSVASGVIGATIAGGGGSTYFSDLNFTSVSANTVTGDRGTISGGIQNTAADVATVAGGGSNMATGYGSAIGGGVSNTASGQYAVVSGGNDNVAAGVKSVVAGGTKNSAAGENTTVGGGESNTASGYGATVPGGINNTASGRRSFAAGIRANAIHDYSVVFSGWDSGLSQRTVDSIGPNTFSAYFPSGYYLYAGAVGSGRGCIINGLAGAGIACSSDRALKTRIVASNPQDVLSRVLDLPVFNWSFIGEEHVTSMGPMAQDFYSAFGLGGNDKYLAAADVGGVALAAIQGLNQKLIEQSTAKDAKISALEKANAVMLREMQAIKTRLGM